MAAAPAAAHHEGPSSAAAAGDQEPDVFVEASGHRYRCMTLKDMERFRDFCLNNEGWTEKFKSPKVCCYIKPPPPGPHGGSFNVVKVTSIFPNHQPVLMYDLLHDADYRATWDGNMIEGYNIVQLDHHNDVGYYSCTFPFPLAKRDFVNQRYWMEFTNGDYLIANFSVPHPAAPVKSGFVRAISIQSGYFIQPAEGGGTKMVYITHSDVKGSIPASVLNFTLSKMAPGIMGKIETNADKYVPWLAENRPPDFVPKWRTAKVSWNRAENAAAAAAAAAAANGAGGGSLIKASAAVAAAAADDGDETPEAPASSKEVARLHAEIEELRRQLNGGGDASGGHHAAHHTLAPVGPRVNDDSRPVQQYRAAMQSALDFVDRQYLEEGRAPASMAEYLTRLRHVVEGIRRTV